MPTREITGVLRDLNGQPYADETVSVSFRGPSATPDATYVTSHRTYRTGAEGRITETIELYANEAGDQASHYLIRMGADTFKAVVPVGEGPLSWSELRALGVTESEPQYQTILSAIKADPAFAGASAYQTWLEAGNVGTEADFLTSLEGAQGVQGEQGAPGQDAPQRVFTQETEPTEPGPWVWYRLNSDGTLEGLYIHDGSA